MKCLVCDKELVINDCEAPDDGTLWETTGNWGSTVYDSMDGRVFLVACVCDECLLKKKDSVVQRRVTVDREYTDTPWTPGE